MPAAAEAESLFAAGRTEAGVVAALRELQTTRRADADRLAQHRGVLAGGDPEAGRAIFERPASSSCIQCHTTRSGLTGGGPPHRLAGSVAGWTRERVLTALIDAGAPGACAQTGVPAALSRFELRDLLAYVAAWRKTGEPSRPAAIATGALGVPAGVRANLRHPWINPA